MNHLKVKYKLDHSAVKPVKAHQTDAGWDLFAVRGFVLYPKDYKKMDTGLHVQIPEGWYGQIEGRSGIASRNGIFPIGGVIDSGYTGEIAVTLVNHSEDPVGFSAGQRIAQLVFHEVPEVEWEEVSEFEETDRGSNGFGSSGK